MGQVEPSLDYTHEHTIYEANYSKDSAQLMRVISMLRLHLLMLVIIVLWGIYRDIPVCPCCSHLKFVYICCAFFTELNHAVLTTYLVMKCKHGLFIIQFLNCAETEPSMWTSILCAKYVKTNYIIGKF